MVILTVQCQCHFVEQRFAIIYSVISWFYGVVMAFFEKIVKWHFRGFSPHHFAGAVRWWNLFLGN
jgi:hypothetical protein